MCLHKRACALMRLRLAQARCPERCCIRHGLGRVRRSGSVRAARTSLRADCTAEDYLFAGVQLLRRHVAYDLDLPTTEVVRVWAKLSCIWTELGPTSTKCGQIVGPVWRDLSGDNPKFGGEGLERGPNLAANAAGRFPARPASASHIGQNRKKTDRNQARVGQTRPESWPLSTQNSPPH